MKRIHKSAMLLAVIFLSIFMTSCEVDSWHNIRGSGPVVSETREVPIHRDIYISVPAEVYIYQSPYQELTLEAQSNVLDAIETYVEGSELKIRLEDGAGLGSHETIRIYISSAMFNSIRLSGSVDLYSETSIVTDVLDVSISGSGKVDLAVVANEVRASISGSGNMWLEGSVINQELTISGSGDIYSFGLDSETADVNISGSGEAEVRVEEFMKARISGSGSVYYKGYPEIDGKVSGSGNIVNVN